jgi:hypothetical protein
MVAGADLQEAWCIWGLLSLALIALGAIIVIWQRSRWQRIPE